MRRTVASLLCFSGRKGYEHTLMQRGLSLVILEGAPPAMSPVEQMVQQVRHSVVLDNIEKFSELPQISEMILATNDRELAESSSPDCKIHFYHSDLSFHFGHHFTEIVNSHRIRKVFYLGGGAGLLLTSPEIEKMCAEVADQEEIFMANNFFSSDFVAFTPAKVVNSIKMPQLDNLLAYLLREEGGLRNIPIESSCGTNFDIDTPADILMLSLLPALGGHTSRTIQSLNLPVETLSRLRSVLRDRNKELMLFGRINPAVVSHFEKQIQCRIRVFSEERGMKARGRVQREEVGSLFTSYLEEIGITQFFRMISRFCDAALIDSRVIFAHMKKKVTRSDRFLSDIGEYSAIEDEFVREFTKGASLASIPIVLGGHSLVSGGLWVLGEMMRIERTED